MQNDKKPLTPPEKQALMECEKAFQNRSRASFEAGRALQRIRDEMIYRENFSTFAFYCVERWDCSRSRADRMIGAWRVYQLLTPIGVKLRHEYQARTLISLTDNQILAAGKLALELAGKKRITSEHFRLAVAQLKPPTSKPPTSSKASKSSNKATAEALTFIAVAEEAAKHDHKAAMLDALAALRACLVRLVESQTRNEKNIKPAVGGSSQPKPETGSQSVAVSKPALVDETNSVAQPSATEPEATSQPNVVPPLLTKHDQAVAQPVAGDPNPTKSKQASTNQLAAILVGETAAPIARWNQIPLFVANWLLMRGTPAPNVQFINSKASEFPASARLKKLSNGSFIDVGDDRDTLLRKARRLLDECGYHDVKIVVQLSNGGTINL